MNHGFQQRRQRLQSKLKAIGASALLVTNIKNVGYLTGFTGSTGYLFMTPADDLLLSDSRYTSQLEEQCPDLELFIRDAKSTMLDSVETVARQTNSGSLAFEADSVSKSEFDRIESKLAQCELVSTSGLVEGLRAIKDESEIAAIRNSIRVNEQTFEIICSRLTPEQTELQVAHNLEHQMRGLGASRCAFEPIVGVGARSALPHGFPTKTQVGDASFLLVDWGAEVDHYMSDLTRMIFTGTIPQILREIYDVVLNAQLAGIDAIRPGVTQKSVDQAARQVIEQAGFGPQFGHGTGHSLGLEIHELPYLSPIHEGLLEAGMVLTVEPGIYLPDFGGVRIEDDVLVTADGCEVLSNLPKQIDECTVDLGS